MRENQVFWNHIFQWLSISLHLSFSISICVSVVCSMCSTIQHNQSTVVIGSFSQSRCVCSALSPCTVRMFNSSVLCIQLDDIGNNRLLAKRWIHATVVANIMSVLFLMSIMPLWIGWRENRTVLDEQSNKNKGKRWSRSRSRKKNAIRVINRCMKIFKFRCNWPFYLIVSGLSCPALSLSLALACRNRIDEIYLKCQAYVRALKYFDDDGNDYADERQNLLGFTPWKCHFMQFSWIYTRLFYHSQCANTDYECNGIHRRGNR